MQDLRVLLPHFLFGKLMIPNNERFATFEEYKEVINYKIENKILTINNINDFLTKRLFNRIEKIASTKDIYEKLKRRETPLYFGSSEDKESFNNRVQAVKDIIKLEKYLTDLQDLPQQQTKVKKTYKDAYWFKVGVKFATGELQQIFEETKNATKTAEQLGNKNLRPYISESISGLNMTDKNIFSRKQSDLDLIVSHCKENNLTICDDFLKILPNQPD